MSSAPTDTHKTFLADLARLVGPSHLLTDPAKTQRYRKGFRSGQGEALAVVFPGTLLELWRVLNACVDADKIILMQAANTGLTEGSTPNGNDYDREIVIISTLRLDKLHLLDKGESGLNGCLNYWDQKMQQYPDILACGVYRDYVDMQQHIRTKEFNGKTVAFLSYTENTNGYSLPDNSELEIVYTSQEDIIQQQIAAAKEIADVVVVTCHWGVEDTYNVTDGVKALAQKIIDWGGDVIIGTHPHVAQTMEYLTRPDGTQGFVFYSLGNFISAQTDNMNLIGELADFNIVAKEDGSVTIEDVKVSPVITQFDDGRESNLRLYPYSMYTDELAAQHGLPYCSSSTGPSYQVWSMEKIRELFDTSVPEQFRNYN